MGCFACHLFNLYIDPLPVQQSNYGYGSHNGVCICRATFINSADDITLVCPSVWGLNEMLKNSHQPI